MSLPGGTVLPNPLGLAAHRRSRGHRAKSSRILAREASAVGINWSFTPCSDINAAFRSAIVATRGFRQRCRKSCGSHVLKQIEIFQRMGMASTIKHWPGEGYDDRDQHLVTTINPLSIDEWERTFGRLYRAAIDAGVLCVMSGHIAFPAYALARPGCGHRSLSTGLDQRRAEPDTAARTARLQRAHRFGRHLHGRAQRMVLAPGTPRRSVHRSGCDVLLIAPNAEGDLDHLKAALVDGPA